LPTFSITIFSYFITINEFLGQAIDLDVTTAAAATGASHASFDAMKALPHKSKVSSDLCRRAMFFLSEGDVLFVSTDFFLISV
jgi:hypothetical protein